MILIYSPVSCSLLHLSPWHALHNGCKLDALLVPPFASGRMWSISNVLSLISHSHLLHLKLKRFNMA
jgi:hypothetical protein